MTDIATIAADPQWLPHRYHGAEGIVEFLRVTPAQMRAATFLADLSATQAGDSCRIPAQAVAGLAPGGGQLHFLFHTAFCRSTLLTRALDIPGLCFGLSEPAILNDLAQSGREAMPLLAPVLALLARPVEGAGTIVVKPSNVANNLLPAVLQARPEARALLLSGALSGFLWSVHKKGLMGRIWTRRLYRRVMQFAPLDLGMNEAQVFELSDMQVAALAWLMQQCHFARHLASPIGPRLATLDSAALMDRRADALAGTARHFGLELDGARLAELSQGEVFSRHAKLGGDFDGVIDKEEAAARSAIAEEEIAMVGTWIDAIVAQLGMAIPARRPVITP